MKLKVEIASFTNLNQIIDFLSKEEKTCITLMSRFIQNDKIAFLPNYIKGYLIFDNKTLIGFLAISDGGIVLHHFDKEIFEFKDDYLSNLAKLIYPILNRHNIYSIVGDYCGTDFLSCVLFDICEYCLRTR